MNTEPDRKLNINMTMDRVACAHHREPMRNGGIHAVMRFGKIAFRFWGEVKQDGEMTGERAEEMLDAKPLCCRISDLELLKCYVGAGVGRVRKCRVCKRTKLGTPVNSVTPFGEKVTTKHVCFGCVIGTKKSG